MRTLARAIFLAVLLIGVFVASAKADTLYTYTGDTFTFVQGIYAQGDRVTGSFVLSDSFVPGSGVGRQDVTNFVTNYSFTDGHQKLTQSNSTATFQVGFNPDGTPVVPGTGLFGGPPGAGGPNSFWYVDITTPTSEILTEFVVDYQTFASIGTSFAEILGTNATLYPGGPGTWTLQRVPEGGTTALFLLAGLTILTPLIGLKRVSRGL